MKTIDLVIIGGGSAGMASALAAKKQGINDILILEKDSFLGGILQQCIHDGFGLHTFKQQLSGPEYAQRFIDEIINQKIDYKLETTVLQITEQKDIYYSNNVEGLVHIKAKSIIIATGCIERTAGAIMLPGKRLSGILTAGLAQKYLNCDGYLVGKKIFILGSGDIGLIMARRFSLEGCTVLGVAEIMPYSNGLNRNIVQCLNDYDIPLYLSHTVKNVIGKNHVEKIVIAQVDEKFDFIENTEKEFECDTLILSVGLIPYTTLLTNNGVLLNKKTKSTDVDEYCQINNGIFACGNVLHVHDLVDYVSEEACLAGVGAAKYIKNEYKMTNYILTIAQNNVSYIVPQKINAENEENEFVLKFRVSKPQENCKIVVCADGKEIMTKTKIKVIPSEMESIKLQKDKIPLNTKEVSIKII